MNIDSLDTSYNAACNKRIIEIFHSNSWGGKRCFVLGGGESLRGFDISVLKGEKVIGVNRAFELGNYDINYCMDTSFFDNMKRGKFENYTIERWKSFTGYKIFLSPLTYYQFNHEVFLLRRLFELRVSKNLNEGIYGVNNSGLGAILLAICLGVSQIYLLGFDMKCKESTHFHSGYGQSLENYSDRLDKFKSDFDTFASLIESAGVKVINLNKDSALKCFEFSSLEKVLREENMYACV